MSSNIGFATIQVVPSLRGVQAALTSQIAGPAAAAGATGGAAMGASMKKAALVGVAAAAAVATALFKVGESFDKASDTIRTGTGATGKTLGKLEKDFKNVVSSVPADFGDAATAVADINTRLGLTGGNLRARSKQFLELSRITGTDVAGNIKTVTRAFGDWEVKTGDQGAALDKFFRAAQSSGATVDELAGQVVQFGAPLRQVGFSLDEATAMFATFEKAGVNTSTMMPGLKMAMKTFFQEGVDPKKGLAAAFKGIQDGSIDASEAIKIFGTRAGGDMIEAVKQGRFELDDMTEALVNGKDTVMAAAKDTRSFGESWKLLKNKALVGIEPLATKVFDGLSSGMAWVTDTAVPALAKLSRMFREEGLGGALANLWATAGPRLTAFAESLSQWVQAQVPAFVARLKGWAEAFFKWITPILPPMLQRLGAMVAKVGAWILETGLPRLVRQLGLWATAFINWAKPIAGPLLGELGKLLLKATGWIVTVALPRIAGKLVEWAWAFTKWVATYAVPWLMGALAGLLAKLGGWIVSTALPAIRAKLAGWARAFGAWVMDAVRALPGHLAALAATLLEWVRGIPGRIVNALGDLGNLLLQAGRDIVDGLIKGLKEKIGDVGETIKGAFDIDLPSITMPWNKPEGGFGNLTPPSGASTIARLQGIVGSVPHTVTSTFRPGDDGWHGKGRAVDFSAAGHNNAGYNSPGLRSIFNAFLPYAGQLKELILAGAPFNIKNGAMVPGYAWGQPGAPGNHWNHVHAAADDGGIFKGPGYVWMGAGQETFASGLHAEKVADLPRSRGASQNIEMVFNEKVNPMHVAAELAWAMR